MTMKTQTKYIYGRTNFNPSEVMTHVIESNEIDRLGRSALHKYQIVEEWRNLDISFSIMTLNIDTSKPTGKFIFGVMAQFAELEREMIIERTNLAMKRIKKSIRDNGSYVTKEGIKITKLGRPKGKKDSRPRKRRGYYLRDYKK